MKGSTNGKRPKSYRVVAILGIVANAFFLVLNSVAIYSTILEAGSSGWTGWLLFDLVLYLLWTPLTIGLMIGSIGLLQRAGWSRSLCVWGLAIDLTMYLIFLLGSIAEAVPNWSESALDVLVGGIVCMALVVVDAAVIVYLSSEAVKSHFALSDRS